MEPKRSANILHLLFCLNNPKVNGDVLVKYLSRQPNSYYSNLSRPHSAPQRNPHLVTSLESTGFHVLNFSSPKFSFWLLLLGVRHPRSRNHQLIDMKRNIVEPQVTGNVSLIQL